MALSPIQRRLLQDQLQQRLDTTLPPNRRDALQTQLASKLKARRTPRKGMSARLMRGEELEQKLEQQLKPELQKLAKEKTAEIQRQIQTAIATFDNRLQTEFTKAVENLEEKVLLAIANLPRPRDGVDGNSIDRTEIATMVAEIVQQTVTQSATSWSLDNEADRNRLVALIEEVTKDQVKNAPRPIFGGGGGITYFHQIKDVPRKTPGTGATYAGNEGKALLVSADGKRLEFGDVQTSGGTAETTTYDNTTSGLTAVNVQEAIDELESSIGAQGGVYVTVGFADADFICDGTDDDVQIQAAIDEVSATGGGTILLKAGTYNVSSSTFVKNNIFIIGEGQSHFSTTSLVQASSAIDIFVFNTTAPVGLRDLIIDGGDLANGVSFQKDALPKIKGTVLDRILIRNCAVGIDAVSSGVSSGPFDDTAFLNLRITNCGIGLKNWNVSTSIFGGVIGGCNTGVQLYEACGLKTYGVVFTGNDRDFDALDQSPFSISINDSYFEGTTINHFGRSVSGIATMGSVNFRGCTFLNTIGEANVAFDFSEATGIASFDFCRFDASSPNSNIIDTNANTTIVVNNTQTSVTPTVTGLGSYRLTGATISGVGDITSTGNIITGMAANSRGFFGKSGSTNILTILRQASPANASVVATVLGAFGITTGTSTAATSNYDFQINTSGQTTFTNTYSEQTTNYTITREDRAGVVNIVGATTANITLPTTGNSIGDTYTIKNSGTGIITVVGTIDDATNYVLDSQYDVITVQYNGSDWIKITQTQSGSTSLKWSDYVLNGFVTNTTVIASGEVLTLTLNSTDYYRYVTTALDANGYPTTDAIYSDFDGTNVPTGLLATRGII